MYAVYLFPQEARERVRALAEDDLISRQSLSTRDAEVLGTDRTGLVVILEGDEKALHRFEELAPSEAERLAGEEAEEAYRLLKAEEEEAAQGVGLLFGN